MIHNANTTLTSLRHIRISFFEVIEHFPVSKLERLIWIISRITLNNAVGIPKVNH